MENRKPLIYFKAFAIKKFTIFGTPVFCQNPYTAHQLVKLFCLCTKRLCFIETLCGCTSFKQACNEKCVYQSCFCFDKIRP